MNKLKQIIIEKIHGLPWEEARWVDSTGYTKKQVLDYVVEHHPDISMLDCVNVINPNNMDILCYVRGGIIYSANDREYGEVEYVPKGEPITLSRVLQALKESVQFKVGHSDSKSHVTISYRNYGYDSWSYFQWKLLKEDKSTAELEDQSEETIKTLELIFNK